MELIYYSLQHWKKVLRAFEMAGLKTIQNNDRTTYYYKDYVIESGKLHISVFKKIKDKMVMVYERRDIFDKNQNMQMEFYTCPTQEIKEEVKHDLAEILKARYNNLNEIRSFITGKPISI